jgi:hypothetical protein
MALGRDVVDAIIREHAYRRITGDVLIIGQQTVGLSGGEVLELMQEHGVFANGGLSPNASAFENAGEAGVSTAAFFRLLGVDAIRNVDAHDADIIYDLSTPIPPSLKSVSDFIVDGGSMADMFSPAITIRNYASMLRPGGRLIIINNLSGHFDPYSIPSPLWYLDYFVCNGFADCKAYVLLYLPEHAANAFFIDTDALLDSSRQARTFLSPHEMAVIVFAEKEGTSTDEVMPTHVHRRSSEESMLFAENLNRIKQSNRPHLVRSRGDFSGVDVRGGHLFIQSDYRPADPSAPRYSGGGETRTPSLQALCVGTGRDGTQSLCHMIGHIYAGSGDRSVMHEYCCREFYQAFSDLRETDDRRYEDDLKRMVSDCAYDCIVGNGYAAILPLFAARYGRGLKIVHLRRADRDACIASLIKNCELFPAAYRYYSTSPEAVVKRMAAFHFGEISEAEWNRLSIYEKFAWYYDKTHALIHQHLSLFDDHIEIKTEDLDDASTRLVIANFIGGSNTLPPPKSHLNASVIDISSFPKEQRHKMHWLMGRLNIEEIADDDVYALDYFLDKFVAWKGYQIAGSHNSGSVPAAKITADLKRAAKLIADRLRNIEELDQFVRDRDDKNE